MFYPGIYNKYFKDNDKFVYKPWLGVMQIHDVKVGEDYMEIRNAYRLQQKDCLNVYSFGKYMNDEHNIFKILEEYV